MQPLIYERLWTLLWMKTPINNWQTGCITAGLLPNALLRCEQRNTDAAAYHLKHQTLRIVKMPRVANHS